MKKIFVSLSWEAGDDIALVMLYNYVIYYLRGIIKS